MELVLIIQHFCVKSCLFWVKLPIKIKSFTLSSTIYLEIVICNIYNEDIRNNSIIVMT